ncbi:MAG: hypothetical protein HUU21_18975 [Polyangiaceae bacterium]|nr:hypothetical protein [Polyangiaceae bacterium]NUQ75634.1 hypothetical protein [Polyangiaceae bacterium]
MRLSPLGFIPVGFLLFASCSDPVPPTPRGAFSVAFVQQSAVECSHAGHVTEIGKVGPSNKEVVVVDGTSDTTIDCTVKAVEGGFSVEATAVQKDKALTIVISKIADTATDMATAPGGLSYSSAKTVDAYNNASDTPCEFYFIKPAQGVAPGRVWVSFKCPKIEAEGSTCEISQGYAIFENCSE